jgi:NADPH:quinone reductase
MGHALILVQCSEIDPWRYRAMVLTATRREIIMQNREILFASRPSGLPTTENFQFVETDVPVLRDGEVLLRTLFISVDPYLRGRMRAGKSYIAPFELGQVIVSAVVGEVIDSNFDGLKSGDIVSGYLGWRLFNVVNGASLLRTVPGMPPSTALGVLGVPGLTAYFGFLDIGKPKVGETVVVSGAAGAVGMTVCQIARIKGCRVVGIAGSDEKNRYLRDELGVDATINYKTEANVFGALQAACPKGVDVYFENVGGPISDAVIPLINDRARIVVCGLISIYNDDKPEMGLKPQPFLLVHSALMQGFIVTQYTPRFAEGVAQLAEWFTSGKLKHAETIVDGFENTPKAFIGLFTGDNLGKQIVRVA